MTPPNRRRLEAIVRDGEGRTIGRCLLSEGSYIIGQSKRCEIVVDNPAVSAEHARLTLKGQNGFVIEDLQTANGTKIDGVTITGPTPISLHSKIELGDATVEFQRGGLPAGIFDWMPEGFLRSTRYNVGEPMVEGSTSTIYEAFDTSLGRSVAMKVMRPESQANAGHVLRFIREAQITSQLQHPGILPVYELTLDEQSRLYYTTRFVEGESLASILDRIAAPPEDPENPEEVRPLGSLLRIFQKVCDAVAYAHSRGVIHTALRPDTISVGAFGEVFVVNWGLAKVCDVDASNEKIPHPLQAAPTNSAPALAPFTAPEQAAGVNDDVNARTDIYALGGILYKILSLKNPLQPNDESELLELALAGNVTPLLDLEEENLPHLPNGLIPERLAAVAMKALSASQEDRYTTVREFQTDISGYELSSHSEKGLWKSLGGFLGGKR